MPLRAAAFTHPAAFAAAALCLAAQPALAQTGERIPSLHLTGHGEAMIDPDMASVSAGVVTQAQTAAEALRQNTEAMNGVFAELRAAGVAEQDMQTSALSVSPVYAPQSGADKDGPRIIAYRASNTVTAIVRDLDGLGPAIDAFVGAGANNVGNISFGREDSSAATDAARADAMRDALSTARLYAEAGGFTLGRILQVSEVQNYRPQPAMMARMESMDSGSTPTAAGQLTIEMQVNVEIEIQQ